MTILENKVKISIKLKVGKISCDGKRVSLKTFLESIYFWEIQEYNHSSYISSHHYTRLPATVKVMRTFMEAILWKPFQLFRRIFKEVSSITKAPSFQYWFQWRKQVKNQLQPRQESMFDSPVLTYFSLLRSLWPKPNGVLEHCCEGKTNCWFSIIRGVSFWLHPQGDEWCQCNYSQFYLQGWSHNRQCPGCQIKTSSVTFLLPISIQRFFFEVKMMISIKNIALFVSRARSTMFHPLWLSC